MRVNKKTSRDHKFYAQKNRYAFGCGIPLWI
nr:MAG TPA: hypothetical protein [Caudoviricetes sp.]